MYDRRIATRNTTLTVTRRGFVTLPTVSALVESCVLSENGRLKFLFAHSSLGPGVLDPPSEAPAPLQSNRHQIGECVRVIAMPMLRWLAL
jgi:hypothetical protein